jgi:hypothetical protein
MSLIKFQRKRTVTKMQINTINNLKKEELELSTLEEVKQELILLYEEFKTANSSILELCDKNDLENNLNIAEETYLLFSKTQDELDKLIMFKKLGNDNIKQSIIGLKQNPDTKINKDIIKEAPQKLCESTNQQENRFSNSIQQTKITKPIIDITLIPTFQIEETNISSPNKLQLQLKTKETSLPCIVHAEPSNYDDVVKVTGFVGDGYLEVESKLLQNIKKNDSVISTMPPLDENSKKNESLISTIPPPEENIKKNELLNSTMPPPDEIEVTSHSITCKMKEGGFISPSHFLCPSLLTLMGREGEGIRKKCLQYLSSKPSNTGIPIEKDIEEVQEEQTRRATRSDYQIQAAVQPTDQKSFQSFREMNVYDKSFRIQLHHVPSDFKLGIFKYAPMTLNCGRGV